MTDVAKLALEVDTRQVKDGTTALDGLANAGEKAEKSTKKVKTASDEMADAIARAKSAMQQADQATVSFISKLEREVALMGKTHSEALKYDSAMMSMTRAQREYTESLIASIAAQEAQVAAQAAASVSFGGMVAPIGLAVAGVLAFIQAVRMVTDVMDAWTNVESRLKLVTSSASELADVQTKLYAIAQETRQSYTELASTYAQVARSAKELNLSQEQTLTVTKVLSQAITVSGAAAGSAQAAMIQLSQGLASGTLRGEELNSVMEQTPRVAQAIADGLGIGIGQLRKMGSEGELTAAKVIGALEKSSKAVQEEFNKMAPTVSGGFTQLSNSAGNFIDKINDATGASRGLFKVLSGIASLLDKMSSGIERGVASGKAGANERARQSLENQLSYMDERDPRYGGLKAQLEQLNRASLSGMAEMPVLNAGKTAEVKGYAEAWAKVNGISSDYTKTLNALKAQYDANGISLEEYRKSVAKLIATETELGKETVKSQKAGARHVYDELFNRQAMMERIQQEADDEYNARVSARVEMMRKLQTDAEKELKQLDLQKRNRAEASQYIEELKNKFSRDNTNKVLDMAVLPESTRQLQQELLKVDEAARSVQEHLSKMLSDGKLTPTEYAQKVSDLTIALAQQKAAVTDLLEAQMQLNGSWEYGASRAMQRYVDSARNVAAQTERLFDRAFQGMEDVLVELAKSGKLNFRSLADTILTELMRIQVRMSLMQVFGKAGGGSGEGMLGSLLSWGLNAFAGNSMGGQVMTNTPDTYAVPYQGAGQAPVTKFDLNANGNVFSGSSLHQYANTVQTSPTYFEYSKLHKFAHGAVFAEAGPEAVMPLARDNRGRLGVRMQDDQAQGGGGTSVVVNNYSSEKATAIESMDSRGNRRVEVVVGELVAAEVRRPGSPVHSANRQSFNAQPALVRR